MNRDILTPLIIALILPFSLVFAAAGAEEWKEVKGEHFIIYYLEDEQFAREAARRAERYYDTIASDLGYSRYDNFWQWENRVKIYIYRTPEEFKEAAGIRSGWPQGLARYKEKEILSYRWSEGFLGSLLPHEITHLVFRDFVGFKGEVPLWLEEGAAEREEESKRKEAAAIVRKLIKEKRHIPLPQLMRMDIRQESDPQVAVKFYAQATTLVNYLIEEYGGSRLTLFYRQLRDGKSVDEALSFVYTGSIPNQEVLEKKWLEYYGGG
ncbi:MAG: peptidase MA family metallohydrolase [Candidatus Omnitrophota bacterium]